MQKTRTITYCPSLTLPSQNERIWQIFKNIHPAYKINKTKKILEENKLLESWNFRLYGHHCLLETDTREQAVKTILPDNSTIRPKFPKYFNWKIHYLDLKILETICNTPNNLIYIYGWPLWYYPHKIRRKVYIEPNEPENPPLLPKLNNNISFIDTLPEQEKEWIIHFFLYPESLLILDIDGSDTPPEIAIKSLPEPFSSTSCLICYSASQGIKDGYRYRIFWQIINSVNGIKNLHYVQETAKLLKQYIPEIDTNIYNPCHPITLAPPIDLRPEEKQLPKRAFMLPGENKYLDIGYIGLAFPQTYEPILISKEWNKPFLTKTQKEKKEPNNQNLQDIIKEKRKKIGKEGHHKQILDYAIILRKTGYEEEEIIKELEDVMATCDRMGKSETEWKTGYDNHNYRKNIARWTIRNIHLAGQERSLYETHK